MKPGQGEAIATDSAVGAAMPDEAFQEAIRRR